MTFATRVFGGFAGDQSGVNITQALTGISTLTKAGKVKVPGFEDLPSNSMKATASGILTPVIGGLPNTGFSGPLSGHTFTNLIIGLWWVFTPDGLITLERRFNISPFITNTSTAPGAPGPPFWDAGFGDNFWFGLSPFIPGIGNGYWINFQQQSGSSLSVTDDSYNATAVNNGAWLRLDVNRRIGYSINSIGSLISRFKFRIASDAAGSNILYTVNNNIIYSP
jgi:hypothetical protein